MKLSKIFNSMYVKWTLAFVALLFIAQAMTAAFSFRGIILETSDILAANAEGAMPRLDDIDIQLTLFASGIVRAMVLNMVLSSVLVSAALLTIIFKIRRVTAATREVARGNFNVELFTRQDDEIGELMRNFNTMTRELRQSEYLKKDFVSTVSHEFKTPITAIEGFARLLQSENLSAEQRSEYTEIIIKETARLGGLSTNLLRLSVLDNSDFMLAPDSTPFYLDEQIRRNILLLERAWEEKNITFDIDMKEMRHNGNEEMLFHVWINILQNAIKFSPHGGTIGVKMSEGGGFVTVEISDSGPGIAPQHHDKIFTRFFKAGKPGDDGNGLGLPIAKRIVELCGGEIGFLSQPGDTTFFVKLPK
ncbi:MAG: HAMP domain-containing histidine kinase [Clostridiales bacterium]|jgi:signal transduction histidine kinase|nr:HAMP domain-containing histidine kinase [Clostridiales bacterium]